MRRRRLETLQLPGDFCWRRMNGGHYILYICPNGNWCGVPILPNRLPNGAGWSWDGNRARPTLTQSINCVGGCRWHGFVREGVMTNA